MGRSIDRMLHGWWVLTRLTSSQRGVGTGRLLVRVRFDDVDEGSSAVSKHSSAAVVQVGAADSAPRGGRIARPGQVAVLVAHHLDAVARRVALTPHVTAVPAPHQPLTLAVLPTDFIATTIFSSTHLTNKANRKWAEWNKIRSVMIGINVWHQISVILAFAVHSSDSHSLELET